MQVDGKRLVELPSKTIVMHFVELNPDDRELYDKVEENGKEIIERFMRTGTVLQNYATVLEIILRLRQICNHSGLCPTYTQMVAGELIQRGNPITSHEYSVAKISAIHQLRTWKCVQIRKTYHHRSYLRSCYRSSREERTSIARYA